LAAFHHGDARIGRAQVDANHFAHYVLIPSVSGAVPAYRTLEGVPEARVLFLNTLISLSPPQAPDRSLRRHVVYRSRGARLLGGAIRIRFAEIAPRAEAIDFDQPNRGTKKKPNRAKQKTR
jgi:hypothetical protein